MSVPTIRDVANRAGASIATVSRALTGKPGVGEATRRRVLLAARELNYQPDQVARTMRRRQSNIIGLCVSTIENVFFTEIAHAAEQAAHQHGYSLLTVSTDERLDREETSIAVLRQQLVAGIILAPGPGTYAERPYLQNDHIPVVLINRDLGGSPYHAILADDESSSFECVSLMIARGHRRIGVVCGLGEISTTRERLAGYLRALTEAGLPLDPLLEVPGQATVEGGYAAVCDLMIRSQPPDAIFVQNNVMLTGALLALQDLGIRWPTDIDICGFGAFTNALLHQPPLTLVAQPTYAMAEQAVSMVIEQINGRSVEPGSRAILSNEIITREDWIAKKAERSASIRLRPSKMPFLPRATTIIGRSARR